MSPQKFKIGNYALQDFLRMNDPRLLMDGAVYAAENGQLIHELPDGYALAYHGDGVIYVQYGDLEPAGYDEHAAYMRDYAGSAFPRRCLELYKQSIAIGKIRTQEEKAESSFNARLEKERRENLAHAQEMAESYRLAAMREEDDLISMEYLKAAIWWENKMNKLSIDLDLRIVARREAE